MARKQIQMLCGGEQVGTYQKRNRTTEIPGMPPIGRQPIETERCPRCGLYVMSPLDIDRRDAIDHKPAA